MLDMFFSSPSVHGLILILILLSPNFLFAQGIQTKNCDEQLSEVLAKNKALEAELAGIKKQTQLKSTEGYRNAKWGMSMAEVRKIFPKSVPREGSLLIANDSVAGKNAFTAFIFTKNKLTVAGSTLQEKYVNKNSYLNDYRQLQALLIKKYGQPEDDKEYWSQELYKDDPSQWGMAVSVGHLTLITTWKTDKTAVELSCTGEKFESTVKVRYASRELNALQEQEAEKETLKDL